MLSKLLEYLDLREPLRTELLEAYFGEGSFISGSAPMSSHDVGALYLLRSSHALCWFASKECWFNFIRNVCLLLQPCRGREITVEDDIWTPLVIMDGTLLIRQLGEHSQAICLQSGAQVSEDDVGAPCFMVTICSPILMQRGVDEFTEYCNRPQPSN